MPLHSEYSSSIRYDGKTNVYKLLIICMTSIQFSDLLYWMKILIFLFRSNSLYKMQVTKIPNIHSVKIVLIQ